ncbi:uncharacterized protein V6R79_012537 [Siganus canaliculatus]
MYVFLNISDRHRKEPPGPRPLPVFGNLLQLDSKSPHTSLYELTKKYGSVLTVHFGPQKTVVLAGSKTIKQALVNNSAFSEKGVVPILNDLKLTHGIVFANGASWKEMRHFALMNLKDFGMGKKTCEDKIIEETQRLIEAFEKKAGEAFDTTQPVGYAVSNIICSVVYGKRFEYDDPVFKSMVARANKNTQLLGSPTIQLYNHFPRLFKWVGARKELLKSAFANRRHIKQLIQDLQDTLNPQMCRGFVDSFLARMQHLKVYTTTQAQEELDRVVGNRQIHMQDRKNLPYNDAVIHEIQRMANVVPSSLHRASADVNFHGYFIKKGTPVLVLLSSALKDENEWEQPYNFYPAHFLDKEGNFRKRDAFIPFSAGARVCVGESLARMELFLFFTSLIQHFRFTPPPGATEDDLDLMPVVGLTLTPQPHKLCAVGRDKQ